MISIDPFSSKLEDIDHCLICHDDISSESNYTLPECNHKYHVNCIIQWFRLGNSNCPYCNSSPNIKSNSYDFYSMRQQTQFKYSIIKNFSKKSSEYPVLKNKVKTIENLNDQIIELKKDKQNIKNEIGPFNEIKKKSNKINSSLWNKNRILYSKKKELCSIVNIIPIIIPSKSKTCKIINVNSI